MEKKIVKISYNGARPIICIPKIVEEILGWKIGDYVLLKIVDNRLTIEKIPLEAEK